MAREGLSLPTALRATLTDSLRIAMASLDLP